MAKKNDMSAEISLGVDVNKSSVNASYRKIQEIFNDKPPILFNVDVRKSSINKAFATIRDEFANKKAVTVNVVPKMDVSKADFAGKNSVDRIKNYIQSLLKDVEVKLTPKFDMRSITASIRNMKQELNKVAGTETDTKVNTLIISNHRGNIDSPEMLSSWIDQISRFNKVAQKIPHGLINVKVNLAANIDENFKQLLNGGLDLSKVKSGKLDINIHDGEGSSSGGGKRKGGKGKSSGGNNLSELDDLPSLTSGDSSKLLSAFNKYFNNNSKLQIKTLEDAIDKATGINFKSMGNNQDVHIQAALSKLAHEAQRYMYDNKLDEAKVLNDLANRLRTEYAKYNSEYANNGIYGPASKAQFNQLGLMSTSDYHKSLDSDRSAKIEEDNKRRAKYQKQLQADLEKGTSFLKNGSMDDVSTLLTHKLRDASNDDVKSRLELLKGYVDEFEKQSEADKKHIREALKEWVDGEVKNMKNILDAMQVRSEDVNKSIRNATAQQLNTANEIAGLNSLSHGESLKEKAFQRANLDGDYDEAIRHYRDKNRQRLERLDPMQGKINDLLNERRGQSESERNSSNQRLVDLVNEKIRLMTDAKQSDFGLKDQIRYLESQLKKTGDDKGAYNSIKSLLDKANKDFNEGIHATYADRVKYFDQMAKEAFNRAKTNATNGKDFTSDINDFLRYANLHTESQLANTKGQSADFSRYATSFQEIQKFGGIDPKLKGELADLEVEYRQLDKAMKAAGDTSKKLDNEFKALQDSVSKINNASGVNKLATDLEKVLSAKFERGDSINREIDALSKMSVVLNNRGLDGEPIAKLARKMQELAQQAKQVTQADKQLTKAQTEQNQAIIKAEQELEILAKKLDNAYRAQTKLDRINPWSKQRQAADAYAKKLEELYNLKRKLGKLRSDGDAAKDLLGRSRVSSNSNFLNSTNSTIQSIFESVAGKFGRQERYSRDRANRTSPMENFKNYVSYGAKFAGRSAKGSGSALEASAMGINDAFELISSSSSMITKGFGVAGLAISGFVGGMAIGIEAISKLVSVLGKLFDVVQKLLQPGMELYQQVTKSTYSMGAAIASNAKFAGSEISLAEGLATSANLQKKAMFDAEKSVFDFGEIMTSLSGTLPLLLGRGMSLSEAYKTNLGVASVAKLTNLAPNQVLQETRDLAQGTITARSSQVANALGISSADIKGKSADEIFKFFEEKFANYEEVLKRYAETPVGAFEQMMDRMKLVSMKFVEQIAYPFKEFFNYLTDLTGSWVDSAKRTYMRVDMGDGQTEQFFRKFDENNNEIANEGAKYTIQGVMKDLNDNLYLLKDAIEQAAKGEADQEQKALLANYGVNADSLVGNKTAYVDVFKEMFGDVFKPIGEEDFEFSEFFEKLKKDFVDVAEYCSKALDELVQYVANAFGIDINDAVDSTSTTIKFLIDMFVWCIEVIVDMVSGILEFGESCSYLIEVLLFLFKAVGNACQILIQFNNLILISFPLLFHAFETFFYWLGAKIKKLLNPLANTSDIDARKDEAYKKLETNSQDFMRVVKGMGNNFADVVGIPHVGDKEFHKFEELWKQGKENLRKYEESIKRQSGKAKDPTQVKGTAKDKVDEKALREARKAEKKAFDRYIAQLRDALERHIQELKDALDKNEAAYKQGLKNYDAYIQEKMKNELEEQVDKRDELLKEIEAIKSTGKYESEDEREKDLYNADKKLQSINTAIDKLTITQSEVTSILSDSNQLLETLVGLNRSANDKKDNSDITTKVETKEESLNTEDLLKYKDINDLDDKKSWAMQYFRESGFASDNASSMLAHTLTNSADLSGNIFGFDSETLNTYATKAGLNLSDATDMFKANIMIATDKIKEAIPTDNDYTLDQFNAELKKLGLFIGEADLSVMNQLAQSFKPFMRQITTTTHTLANANSVVNQAVNGYKEWIDVREDGSGTGWMGNVTSNPSIQCDSWTGDVYAKSGIDLGRSIVNDEDFRAKGLWHDSNGASYDGTTPMADGYKAKPGDTIGWHNPDTDSWHYGIIIDDNMLMSRDSTGGLTTHTFAEARELFGPVLGIGEVGPLLGGSSGTNAIKDVVEKIVRGTASTYTGNGLQAIEMKEKYLTTEFNLQAQLDKYEQTVFDSVKAASKSAEVIKKGIELQFDIFKTTGINDEQQKRIVDKKERLKMFQLQELIGKQLKEQLEYQLSDIEALFNYDLTASASRVDYALITKNYQDIFTNMDNDIHRTINSIKEMIDKADAEGNRALGKDLRQALYKVTNKLNEFFDKAEDAVNKQYDYIESAMNNIGATNLQKEGLSKRFNIAKNRELAKVYHDKEVGLTAQYRELTERALKETKDLGSATGATLTAIADVQERLLKNHWALQQAEELGKFKTALEEANDVFKQSLEDGLVDFMTDGVNAVLEGTKTIGDAFRELAVSILKTMQQFFAKKLIENLMNKLYPMDDDIKRVTDTANWQPRDLFVNKENQTIYNQQMSDPRLESVMREGYIIKNPVNDVVNAYDHGWRPEYEAINPADALAQQLQKTSNSLGQFDSALWKFIDEANGKTIYPDESTTEQSNDLTNEFNANVSSINTKLVEFANTVSSVTSRFGGLGASSTTYDVGSTDTVEPVDSGAIEVTSNSIENKLGSVDTNNIGVVTGVQGNMNVLFPLLFTAQNSVIQTTGSMLGSIFTSIASVLVGVVSSALTFVGQIALIVGTIYVLKFLIESVVQICNMILDVLIEFAHAVLNALEHITTQFFNFLGEVLKFMSLLLTAMVDWGTSVGGLARALFGNKDGLGDESSDYLVLLNTIVAILSNILALFVATAEHLGVDTSSVSGDDASGDASEDALSADADALEVVSGNKIVSLLNRIANTLDSMQKFYLYGTLVSVLLLGSKLDIIIRLLGGSSKGLFGLFADGGYISGPGTSTSDSIPAMLSDGEFVVKASAVKKYGTNFLNAVNDGTFATIKPRHHYASGGLVTETAREATSTVVTELGRGIGTNINNEAHFNLVMASNQEDAMKAFMRSPEGQRIYLDMARKYASTTVRF